MPIAQSEEIQRRPVFEYEFDFEEWVQLQQDDPAAFEEKRKQLVKQFIESSPTEYQRRLRGLDFQMNVLREQSSNPMDACIKISKMMWDSFSDMRGVLTDNEAPVGETTAKVLRFPAAS